MPQYDLDESAVVAPEETGEVTQDEESKKTEVPEESGETEEKKVETDKDEKEEVKDDKEPDNQKESDPDKKGKKYAGQFESRSVMVKSAENLAAALGEEVNFDNLTVSGVEEWYVDARKRFSKEGFKGDRTKTKRINEAAKNDEAKLDKFVETRKSDKVETPPAELKPPTEPVMDWEAYHDSLYDDPKAAAKMMVDFQKAQREYVDKRIEYEGAVLGKGLQPIAEGYQRLTRKEQEEVEAQEWGKAGSTVKAYLKEHFGEDEVKEFDSYYKDGTFERMTQDDFEYYNALANSKGKEQAIFKLFQHARQEKRLEQLESDFVKLKNGETLDQIESAKKAASTSPKTGGTQNNKSTGLTAAEAKAKSLAAVRGPSSKYDLNDVDT
jgi:hypothetical protein